MRKSFALRLSMGIFARPYFRKDKEMKVFYDKDCDLSLIKGKTVAIIGYGSQGTLTPKI